MTTVAPVARPGSGPANPWLPQTARIVRIRPEIADVVTYELVFEDPRAAAAYRFEPGQFNMLYLPGSGESAISISSDPDEHGSLAHTVRAVGNVTRALARLRAGDRIGVRGPFGAPWPVAACRGNDVVIAAGGLGLAPVRPMIRHVAGHRADFGRVFVLCGARNPAGLLYADEFDAWRAAGIEVHATVDIGGPGWTGEIGVVPALLERVRLDPSRTRVLTCGPEVMMRFVAFEALAAGVRAEDVFVSLERNMSCAVGLCGHCQLGPAFVCRDGPVLPWSRMEPFLRTEDL